MSSGKQGRQLLVVGIGAALFTGVAVLVERLVDRAGSRSKPRD